MLHQTRAASETLSALLGGDSVKRLSFMRFMTMETPCILFKDWFCFCLKLLHPKIERFIISFNCVTGKSIAMNHEHTGLNTKRFGINGKNWDWICHSIYHSQLRHAKVLLRS